MEKKLRCFVIIGYGKKPSYANGKHRVLDLDQTYRLLIKPVFDELGIDCYRAIDKNVNGSIDELMLREIYEADIALADISTLNANVMWELGVRHALKRNYTVMICEQEQMGSIPFDINHFIVHKYVHSEVGIPYEEVEKFRTNLKGVIEKMLKQDPPNPDSPVFQFIDPYETYLKENGGVGEVRTKGVENEATYAELIDMGEAAKDSKEFTVALKHYRAAKEIAKANMILKDNLEFIVAREALCIYKAKPGDVAALKEASEVMKEVNPENSMDLEVLGISGGISKRLYQITKEDQYLEKSIAYYEKGFLLKQDYFNGINAVFMLYLKAKGLKDKNESYTEVKLKADYMNLAVMNICLNLKSNYDPEKYDDLLWILYTTAETYHYKGDKEKQKEYEELGDKLSEEINDAFAKSSYYEQSGKIDEFGLTDL